MRRSDIKAWKWKRQLQSVCHPESYNTEEENKLEFSDESSSESSGSYIHGEGDYSSSDVQSDQDSDHIQKLRDASNFNKR